MNYGRYQIVSELGRGSMGVVYQAHDPQINRLVALKVLREDRVTSEDYLQRFLKEATAIGRLSHPGIVTVYDVGQDHGTVYIAMEFLEGEPLDQFASNRKLSLRNIVKIGVQVAQALHYAHEKGIVHRDIKPPNIIYTGEETIKVTDFGIAHIDDPDGQQITRAGEILGTPVYMAPEQVMGQPVDGRSDLYSLGVILYELTTGKRPFQGENLTAVFRAITQDDPIPPEKLNPDVPSAISKLILKTMAKRPEDRFTSGRDLADHLDSCLNKRQQPPRYPPTPEKRRFGPGLILMGTLLLAGAGLAVYLNVRPPDPLPPGPKDNEQHVNIIPPRQTEKIPSPPSPVPPPDEKIPDTVPVSSSDRNAEPRNLITVTPNVRKIKMPLATKKESLPKPVVDLEPVSIPEVEGKLPLEQGTESIDELFTEEKHDMLPSSPADTDGSERSPVATETVTTDIALLTQSDKEQKTDDLEKPASLKINSSPPGARLYLDGDYKGETPVELKIAAKKYEVKLELQGHLDWKAQLNLSKGGEFPLPIISLSPE